MSAARKHHPVAPAVVQEFVQRVFDAIVTDRFSAPALPELALQALQLLSDADASLTRLVPLIQQDPFLLARVLSIANSAHYQGRSASLSLRQAIPRIGAVVLRQVVVTALLGRRFVQPGPFSTLLRDIWTHSVSAAVAARLLAGLSDTDPDQAYTAALLHDIGETVLVEFAAQAPQCSLSFDELGLALDLLHEETGAFVAQAWGLPPDLVAAIEHHHHPETLGGALGRLATLVRAGCVIAQQLTPIRANTTLSSPPLEAMLGRLDIDPALMDSLLEQSRAQTQRMLGA